MIRAVIFDLDNTLVDFMSMKKVSVEASITAMIDAGLDMEREKILEKINLIYNEKGLEYQNVFDDFLLDNFKKIDYKILSAGIVAYRKYRETFLVPYPHATSTLIELIKRQIKLAVVSDAPQKEAWLRLSYLNYSHIFDCVVTFDDTGERKPSPTPFLKALDFLKIKPSEAIMIGDWAERDMVGAKNIGMKTVFARYGDTFETMDPNSDYEITDIRQILDIIEKEDSKND